MHDLLESPEARFAADAVREAAVLVRSIQRALVGQSMAKSDLSPVTVADFAAQALVARRLSDQFPGACLVAEEDAEALRAPHSRDALEHVAQYVGRLVPEATPDAVCTWINIGGGGPAERFWTLDPVDGTKGFLRNDQFAVALALVENGEVTVGALACPELEDASKAAPGGDGSLILAVRGKGTYTQPIVSSAGAWKRLRVSAVVKPESARLLRSVESSHTDVDGVGALATELSLAASPVAMDSQAKYAVLAAGGGEILLRLLSPKAPDYREKIWDQAAGSIVVEEAGGRVTDLDGKDLDFTRGRTLAANRGVLATNGALHDKVLNALRAMNVAKLPEPERWA